MKTKAQMLTDYLNFPNCHDLGLTFKEYVRREKEGAMKDKEHSGGQNMRHPSVKTLKQSFGDKALLLRKIIDDRKDPEDFPSVESWVKHCYNKPDQVALQLNAINEILEGFGVECIRLGDHWAGATTDDDPVAEYINMGDAYDATILYSHYHRRFEVCTWGDWVEWAERKGIIAKETP